MASSGLTLSGAQLLALILNALHGLMHFYAKDYTELNVDGLFGLRIIQGQLKHIWITYESHLPPEVVLDLKNLSVSAERLANRALVHTFSSEPAYFRQFKYLLNQPYSVFRATPRLGDNRLIWNEKTTHKVKGKANFKENQSDSCIAELLTRAALKQNPVDVDPMGKKESKESSENVISNKCLSYMLGRRGLNRYKLTHQILYASVAELVDVKTEAEAFVSRLYGHENLDAFVTEWCANVINEMHILTAHIPHMDLDPRQQDLFMEQVFVCGQYGFLETTSREWLQSVLSWQDPTLGCYGRDRKIDKLNVEKSTKLDLDYIQQRRLKFEKIAQDSCASHASAVAAGALTVFLHFLLDPGPKEWSHMRMDLQRTEYPVKISAAGQFKTYEYPNWVSSEEFSVWDRPPPKNTRVDISAYLAVFALGAFLALTWRLFCRRRRMQMYPFSFKKL